MRYLIELDASPADEIIALLESVSPSELQPISKLVIIEGGIIGAVVSGDTSPGQALDSVLAALDAVAVASDIESEVAVNKASVVLLSENDQI